MVQEKSFWIITTNEHPNGHIWCGCAWSDDLSYAKLYTTEAMAKKAYKSGNWLNNSINIVNNIDIKELKITYFVDLNI